MKSLYLIVFISLLSLSAIPLFAQNELPKDLCISSEEYRLYELINSLRRVNDKPSIDLSASLTHVAHLHVSDLNKNHPDTSICNLHSWSDKGKWTPCCYQNYVLKQECMWGKPKELTPYKYRGYELAYFDSDGIIPDSLMMLWLKIPAVQDMLLNRGAYAEKKWLAAGVGIQSGYAVVWFGQVKDAESSPKRCDKEKNQPDKVSTFNTIEKQQNTESKSLIVNEKTGRFYLIFGSYNREKDAEKQVKKYIKAGFPDAKIVISSQKIRISLSDHVDLDGAKAAKAKLSKKYEDAWIIKF